MKKLYIFEIVIAVIFCWSGISAADGWKNESGNGHSRKSQYNHHDHAKGRPDKHGHGANKRTPDYYNHHAYRERPYDKRRHYDHFEHKGHRYKYEGHWRSWKQWDSYAKLHPEIYKHGRYYRENAHLMFRFCEPLSGNCFFFSIGS